MQSLKSVIEEIKKIKEVESVSIKGNELVVVISLDDEGVEASLKSLAGDLKVQIHKLDSLE